MTDKMKIPASLQLSWGQKALSELFVEFLRGISRQDATNHEYTIARKLWEFEERMSKAPPEMIADAVAETIKNCLTAAREHPGPEYSHHRRVSQVATTSAKVLAEKISGVKVQQSRAEHSLFKIINILEQEREANIRKWRSR